MNVADLVTQIPGEPLRYMVRSRRPNIPDYLVDLAEYDGNGKCPCEDFTFRREPQLVRGHKPHPSMRCYHIRLARQYLADEVIRRVLEAQVRMEPKRSPAVTRFSRDYVLGR